ncbi:MAG: carboxymuconolactone decarboxylase family protein [Kordiimonadaceae bacterium]|nr:carboxymuconolactone decarboxylase family protein [Kordiimonadaceae bacterium]
MTRLNPINIDQAQGKSKELLTAVKKAMGATPNIFTAMTNAPAVLEGYLNFNGALSGGTLTPQLREQIALVTAGANGCGYCASAHTYLGDKAGIKKEELTSNLSGHSSDAKTQSALSFARKLIDARGAVSETDIQSVRNAGFDDAHIIEILAHVALNTFTNYFNEAFKTEIDFPKVEINNAQKAA